MTTLRPDTASPVAFDSFETRHIGPSAADREAMLRALGYAELDTFIDAAVPAAIRMRGPLAIGPGRSEHEVVAELRAIADLKVPLVKLRGQWVQVNAEEIRNAIEFLQKKGGR
ncbi:MAG: hypothetical protein M3154_02370, partial [Candidatus Eremiobacteraeota bacterium]|nr:hypothetical protein [Candidatus Eremiobacteraeota bacterium]